MELINEVLKSYLEDYCEPEPELLKHIDRETNLKVLMPRMVSGHYQGRVISLLSKIVNPRRVLEIGTFTGYATLCFAEGLSDDGKIITLDINEELEDRVRSYFASSEYTNKIDYRIGNAVDAIPLIEEIFDIVFIDKVRKGGLIIVDNVLWSGKVLDDKTDKDTSNIINFNDAIAKDTRVEKLILPVRDGLFIIRKK
jgi:caffeoyl-CoA O-methyltransferase